MDTPSLIIPVAAVLVIVLIVWAVTRKQPRSLPYSKRPSLLSAGELRFRRVLLPAVPPGVMVCVKVRLMEVVTVSDNVWQEYGAKGSGMHLDFVLADAGTMAPLLAVELDDRSHD